MLTPDVVITGQCQPQGPAPQTPGARAGTSCPAQVMERPAQCTEESFMPVLLLAAKHF